VTALKAHLYDQFRLPRGPLGVLAGRAMARRSSNRDRSAWTVELLDLRPGDRVLELGFGPGLGLQAVRDRLPSGRLVGVDHSATMLAMARRRLRAAGGDGVPAELRLGDAAALPADLGVFDKVFSCNVWLFWRDPVAVLTGLRAHLAPGATVAVTHLPRHGGADRAATTRAGDAITAHLAEAGYLAPRRELLELAPAPAVCVLATAPG